VPYENEWVFEGEPLDENALLEYQGFVYAIRNKINGKQYIGKKNFWASKTTTKKGKRKRSRVESDWRKYYGSSEHLQKDIVELGVENFERKVLCLCRTKGELGYKELCFQMDNRVLEKPLEYYNSFVGGKFHRMHIKALIATT
jgi:hypothetical protein